MVLIWYFLNYFFLYLFHDAYRHYRIRFQNEVEASHILHLARKLEEKDRKYRIITGYEGQRSYIENLMMKEEDLEWGDKCFNVDSFQGNIFHKCFIFFFKFQLLHRK